MSKIYLSSTFMDLKVYRDKVFQTLEKLNHKVIRMEGYTADDEVPLIKCVTDVQNCDVYIGIFGWRYGFIPPMDNEQNWSITEHEYRVAQQKGIPCLIFLSAENVPVLPENMDAFTGNGDGGERIRNLRKELGLVKTVATFTSPDDLSLAVVTALQVLFTKTWEGSIIKAEEFAKLLSNPMNSSEAFDITGIITKFINPKENVSVLDIDLKDGDYWWSTRLFLLAALIVDYTAIGCFSFTGNNVFIGLTTPLDVLKNMSRAFSAIAKAYYNTLEEDYPNMEEMRKISRRVENFRYNLNEMEGGEENNKIKVNKRVLQKWLGSSFKTEIIANENATINFDIATKILQADFKYIPIVSNDKVVSIIDKNELANNIAAGVLSFR